MDKITPQNSLFVAKSRPLSATALHALEVLLAGVVSNTLILWKLLRRLKTGGKLVGNLYGWFYGGRLVAVSAFWHRTKCLLIFSSEFWQISYPADTFATGYAFMKCSFISMTNIDGPHALSTFPVALACSEKVLGQLLDIQANFPFLKSIHIFWTR